MSLTVMATDSVSITERRLLLSVGYEEVSIADERIVACRITDERVVLAGVTEERIDQ